MSDTGRQSMTDNVKGALKVCVFIYLSQYCAMLNLPVLSQPDSQKGIVEQTTDKMDSMAGSVLPGVNISFLSTSFTITNPYFFTIEHEIRLPKARRQGYRQRR